MRFVVYKRIWHGFDVLHRPLLLMMGFDCPLAFHHKKVEYIVVFERTLCFCFQGESISFCWLELVELFRLYLGASLCILLFLALATFALFCWDIHVKGSIFFFICFLFQFLIDLCL